MEEYRELIHVYMKKKLDEIGARKNNVKIFDNLGVKASMRAQVIKPSN